MAPGPELLKLKTLPLALTVVTASPLIASLTVPSLRTKTFVYSLFRATWAMAEKPCGHETVTSGGVGDGWRPGLPAARPAAALAQTNTDDSTRGAKRRLNQGMASLLESRKDGSSRLIVLFRRTVNGVRRASATIDTA